MATFEHSGSGESMPGADGQPASLEIAGPGRRVGAGFVDSLAVSLTTVLAFRVADALGVLAPGWVALVVAEFVIVVAPIAVTGRPLGAMVAGTTVIRSADQAAPGWSASVRRWFVAHLPVLVVAAVAALGVPDSAAIALALLQVFGLAVVYAGVLVDPNRQGLHDRAAGTLVVLHRRDSDAPLIEHSNDGQIVAPWSAALQRKGELMAIGSERLLGFVQSDGYVHRSEELSSVVGGDHLVVLTYRPVLDGVDDVLVAVTIERNGALALDEAIEAFAIRTDGRINELTDDEWALIR